MFYILRVELFLPPSEAFSAVGGDTTPLVTLDPRQKKSFVQARKTPQTQEKPLIYPVSPFGGPPLKPALCF